MGLISPGGVNLLDLLELRQVPSTYDGDLRDPLWGPQERPGPCELLAGLSGFLFRLCRGLRSCVESVPEPEDSSPMLTWILGYSGVSPGESVLVMSGACKCTFLRAAAAVLSVPSRGSRDLWLSLEAFPRGFPRRLSHRALPRVTVV